jgi:hypothetical protein
LKKQYQVEQQRAVREFRRMAPRQNPNIQMILPFTEIVSLLPLGIGCDGAKRCWGCAKARRKRGRGEQPLKRGGERGVDFCPRPYILNGGKALASAVLWR